MNYIPYIAVFSSGERFPVLLHRSTYQPVILPTRYVIDERRETKQSGTIERDVRVLGWLFEWADQRQIDLEARLREGHSLTTAEISSFCQYLRVCRTDTIVVSINEGGNEEVNVLSPSTFNAYTGVIENFLLWAAYQFPSATSAKEIKYSIEIIKERLMRAFRSNRVGGESPNRRGLSEEEVIELRKVIKLGTQQNPFRRPVQFRNYVIIKLLLATGIRRGELLKLKLSHLPQGPKTTLTIERSPDDKLDSRRIEPQVKTRERNIPVLKPLSIDLWTYVQKHRKGGKHPYVFTNSRNGAPLTSVGLNWIFDVLVKKCFPSLKGRLHPHIMRHTFNDGIMMQAIALGWSDDQRRKTQTYLNGWNEGSNMTEVYSRRIIEMKAMEVAEAYQKGLYIF